MINFDEIIDRTGTNSIKHAFKKAQGIPENAIPLWVADMDFRSPAAVCEHVVKAGQHGIFGYAGEVPGYFEALYNWNLTRHNWKIEKEWVVRTPGVVTAIAAAVQAFTEKDDSVMIMSPVYFPFRGTLMNNHRRVVEHELTIGADNRFYIDFEKLEQQVEQEAVKMLIWCSPHNPGGRIWSREELQRLSDICLRHKVLVVSDEIHYDFVFEGHTHTVYATLSEEAAQNSIICTAPSKTFNVAGLEMSNILIPNPEIRERFQEVLNAASVHASNMIGIEACRIAYESGAGWLDELLVYLQGNVDLVRSFLQEHIPEIRMMEPDGTYLLWLDCRGLEKVVGSADHETLNRFFLQEAGVWFNDGFAFGENANGFFRMNIGTPRKNIQKALEQMEAAIHK